MTDLKQVSVTPINVTIKIGPGSSSPSAQMAWSKFWRRITAEVNAAEKEQPPNQAPANDALAGGTEEGTSHESEQN